ncbi:MAG: 4Fe-4S binding protein [Candidatus Latescibacteria bacterium]|nr:4Fe-4S binding protein [Candidatus Latescibacterota bacterium]
MCEFCQEHGEGKKWYLQMKNYSRELLREELTPEQQQIVGKRTRREWVIDFFRTFSFHPPKEENKAEEVPHVIQPPKTPKTEDQIVYESKVEHFGQVLPIEDVEQVIDMVNNITRLPCGCRYYTTGKPDERYCFGVSVGPLGTQGTQPDSSFEVLTKDDAKKLFRKFDHEGLMHSIWTGVSPFVIGMCNCDHDCAAYRGYIVRNGAPNFFRAEYICETDWDKCTGCKKCMQQCQFNAMYYSSSNKKVYINPTKCFGCGVCRTACSKNAINLISREQNKEAANLWLKK